MSIVVYHAGRRVWAPALAVGRLFAAQVAALEPVAGAPSGFRLDEADEVHIGGPEFLAFADRLAEQLATTANPQLRALADGPAGLVFALAHAIGGTWPADPRLAAIVRDARTRWRPPA